MFTKLIEHYCFLVLIDFFYSFQHMHIITILFSCFNQRLYIFWKTRATISTTRIKKLTTNTTIRSYSFTYHIYIRTYQLTQISNIIHKRDTGSKHRVSRIFYHFSWRNISKNHTKVVQQKRTIKPTHKFFCFFRLYSHHYTIWAHKIFDSCALFQKFRVACYIKRNLYSTFC